MHFCLLTIPVCIEKNVVNCFTLRVTLFCKHRDIFDSTFDIMISICMLFTCSYSYTLHGSYFQCIHDNGVFVLVETLLVRTVSMCKQCLCTHALDIVYFIIDISIIRPA